jgi:SAM-dependent methyltransferase
MLRTVLKEFFAAIRSAKQPGAEGDPGNVPAPSDYSPEVFEARDLRSAKATILNAAPDMTTDQRWELETRNLVPELGRSFALDAESTLIDYGCGVGRLAKGLIDRYGCRVFGVDISAKMRELAPVYVASDLFTVCDPSSLDAMISDGFRADHAYACWVLQHCIAPHEDVERIRACLNPEGRLYVLNSMYRWLPTNSGWKADDISIEALLSRSFDVIAKSGVRHLVGSEAIANESYALLLERRH